VANRNRPIRYRFVRPLPIELISARWRKWRRLLLAFTSLAALLAIASVGLTLLGPGGDTRSQLEQVLGPGLAGLVVVAWAGNVALEFLLPKATALADYIREPEVEAGKGRISDVSDQVKTLIYQALRPKETFAVRLLFAAPLRIGAWILDLIPAAALTDRLKLFLDLYASSNSVLWKPEPERRFVVFVDDLERCRPPRRALEVCEVAAQILKQDYMVLILLADIETLAATVTAAYGAPEGSDYSSTGTGFGRRYFEKMVQFQLDLPPPSGESVRTLAQGLVSNAPSGKGA
jgi:hypothetical protein